MNFFFFKIKVKLIIQFLNFFLPAESLTNLVAISDFLIYFRLKILPIRKLNKSELSENSKKFFALNRTKFNFAAFEKSSLSLSLAVRKVIIR